MRRRLKTIRKKAELEGLGIHSGEPCRLTISPADKHGVWLSRTDLACRNAFLLSPSTYKSAQRCSVAQFGCISLFTAEHLLAAIYALNISSILIECNAPELPAGDGSADCFVKLLNQAEIVEQASETACFRPVENISLEDGGASILCQPSDSGMLRIRYELSLSEFHLPDQFVELDITDEAFLNKIAPARTFIHTSQADGLRAKGFGKGANIDNTLLLGSADSTERVENEAAMHKITDMLGDLCALGFQLSANVVARRSGHKLNNMLLAALARQLCL